MAENDNTLALNVGIGLAVGAGAGTAIGAALGAATGDMGIWLIFGSPIGSSIGLLGGIIYTEMQKRSKDICPACGYSTRGLKNRICPECGGALDETDKPNDESTNQ